MSYGKALERRVAELIEETPELRRDVTHLGGPNQPDFTVELPDGSTMRFDPTTDSPREVSRHLNRPYGEGLELLPYRRPDGLVPFPADIDDVPKLRDPSSFDGRAAAAAGATSEGLSATQREGGR